MQYINDPHKIALLMEDVVEEGFREMAAAGMIGAGTLLGGGCDKTDISAPPSTAQEQVVSPIAPAAGDVKIDNGGVIRYSASKSAAGVILPATQDQGQEWCQSQLEKQTGKTWQYLDTTNQGRIVVYRFKPASVQSAVAASRPDGRIAQTTARQPDPPRPHSIFDEQ